MKLRFGPNSIRLRLNQVEVAKFAREGLVLERVEFPGSKTSALVYSLRIGQDKEGNSVRFENGEVAVLIPAADVKAWAENAKEVGIYFTRDLEEGKSLRVSIEKDFQCSDGPPEEVDPAAYPNPLAKAGCKTERR